MEFAANLNLCSVYMEMKSSDKLDLTSKDFKKNWEKWLSWAKSSIVNSLLLNSDGCPMEPNLKDTIFRP